MGPRENKFPRTCIQTRFVVFSDVNTRDVVRIREIKLSPKLIFEPLAKIEEYTVYKFRFVRTSQLRLHGYLRQYNYLKK